ncbi:MAG: SDR family NAD(P)-dependent oxidoreductase, partial [Pseudomonadales bacterium]
MDRSVIFITGAASGIGRATAKLFSARGWFVGATDVNEADLLALEQELSAECFTAQLDVTNKPQFDDVMTRFSHVVSGRLDLLFNNAGIAKFGFLEDLPYEEIMATINVNFVGVLNGVTAAIPLLKATPNSLCFTTASSAANFGTPGLAVYGATKSAVKHLTESLSV